MCFYKVITFSHGCQAGFYISESYPPLEYLEYPLLVLQNFTLLFLVGTVSGSLFKSLQYITAFSTLISVIGGGYFTKSTILMAMVSKGKISGRCPFLISFLFYTLDVDQTYNNNYAISNVDLVKLHNGQTIGLL